MDTTIRTVAERTALHFVLNFKDEDERESECRAMHIIYTEHKSDSKECHNLRHRILYGTSHRHTVAMTKRPSSKMSAISKASRSKKKGGDDRTNDSATTSTSTSSSQTSSMCNFCTKTPPALLIQLPVLGRKKRAATPYCLSCYYTTSAVRQDPEKYVSVLNKEEQARQLPAIQHLFSECFLELQEELSEESVRAFKKQKSDPLAMLNFSSASASSSSSSSSFAYKKKRKLIANKGQAPDPRKKKEGNANDGGFLRDIDLSARLRKTQKEQQELQNQQLARMNQAASAARRASRTTTSSGGSSIRSVANNQTATTSTINNRRRKGSGKSIWNLAMDKGPDGSYKTVTEDYSAESNSIHELNHSVTCTCGSKDVRSFGNITSRNQDVRKGEIWGSGDRGEDVITRFQCNKCGRTWNEVE